MFIYQSTWVKCDEDNDCLSLNHTTCERNWCTCENGYGIHKFVQDMCVEIPSPTESKSCIGLSVCLEKSGLIVCW